MYEKFEKYTDLFEGLINQIPGLTYFKYFISFVNKSVHYLDKSWEKKTHELWEENTKLKNKLFEI